MRRRPPEVGRALRRVRRVEHARRGGRDPCRGHRAARRRRAGGTRTLGDGGSVALTPRLRDVERQRGASLEDGHRRVRLRARRRHRPGLDGAHRRRARHRQVDAAAAGRGARCRAPASPTLYVSGEESRAAGQAARRPARRAAPATSTLLSETNLETILATAAAAAPGRADRRLDPDRLHRRPRRRAGQRGPGARVRRAADALRQGERHRGVRRRARHQGRRHRRPEDARAHRRHGAVLRGREHRSITACCARPRTASAASTRSACSA